MNNNGVLLDGFPSMAEIEKNNGWPTAERFTQGPVAILECVQEIPCNPCEDACPFHAIHIGNPITTCPTLAAEKCTGCGICVSRCPGLAIFIVDKTYSETEASISFPFEYFPLPAVGDTIQAVNRGAEFVCEGKVLRVVKTKIQDHTPVITISIPKDFADHVRSIRRLNAPLLPVSFEAATANELLPDDVLVCRCEEVSAGEIRRAIHEEGVNSVTAVKRRVRAGMGLCQGKTCGRIITRLISEELGLKPQEILPSADRPPVRPIKFSEIGGA